MRDTIKVGLFDPTKKVEPTGMKIAQIPDEFLPGGIKLLHAHIPVVLAAELFDHLYLLEQAKTTGVEWLRGTDVWKAICEHFRTCNKPNKCMVEMKKPEEHFPYIQEVTFYKKYTTRSDNPEEENGRDFIRVMFTVFDEKVDLCIPLRIVQEFKKSEFDEWVESVADLRVRKKKKTAAYHQLRTLLHSGELTLPEIKGEIAEYENEQE